MFHSFMEFHSSVKPREPKGALRYRRFWRRVFHGFTPRGVSAKQGAWGLWHVEDQGAGAACLQKGLDSKDGR